MTVMRASGEVLIESRRVCTVVERCKFSGTDERLSYGVECFMHTPSVFASEKYNYADRKATEALITVPHPIQLNSTQLVELS
jgi:hypothetical protein